MKDKTAQSPHRPHSCTLQILLLEESLVNQKLVTGILKSQYHEVTVAINRDDAVVCLESQKFDLVLMDTQLSGLDGVSAVSWLRGVQQDAMQCLPIIAMSSDGKQGDRDALLAAGVNDYVNKPMRAAELLDIVRRVCIELFPDETPEESAPTGDLVCWQVAMTTVQGDYQLLVDLLEAFLTEGPQLMQCINEAVAHEDLERLHIAAHTIKSGFRYFGATQAQQLALDLETLARSRTKEGIVEPARQLNAMWPAVEQTLQDIPPPERLAQLSLDG